MKRNRNRDIPSKTTVQRWFEEKPGAIRLGHKHASAISPSGERIYVDVKMKPILQSLWVSGYNTMFSCQGGKHHGWSIREHLGSSPASPDSPAQICFATERHQLVFLLTLKEILPEILDRDFKIMDIVNPGFEFHPKFLGLLKSNIHRFPNPDAEEEGLKVQAYILSSDYEIPRCVQFPAYNEYRTLRNGAYPEHTDPPLEEYPEDYPIDYTPKVKPQGFTSFRMG